MTLRRISFLFLFAVSFIITGCPVSSNYPLAASSAAMTLNKNLLGTWKTDKEDADVKLVKFEEGKEINTYYIKVLEKGSMFSPETSEFTGWLTQLKQYQFLVLKETGTGASKTSPYYVYAISTKGNRFVTNDISLKVKGTDAITSIAAYQEEVIASMPHEEFLADPIEWYKK